MARSTKGVVLWKAPGHVLARWDRVLLQLRTGEMTAETLSQIEMIGKLERAKMDRSMKRGGLFVAANGAPPPRWDVVRRQQQLLAETTRDPLLYAAGVIEGDGIGAMAQRGVIRLVFGSVQRGLFGTVPEGARWLAAALDGAFEAGELVSWVRSVRNDL